MRCSCALDRAGGARRSSRLPSLLRSDRYSAHCLAVGAQQVFRPSRDSGKPARGASTISQQCARSLFLWHKRSWLRKGLEAYYTVCMEILLPKKRILELYLNAIELGDGVYGLEAAAKHHYGIRACELSAEQSAMLAIILPKPKSWNPNSPTPFMLRKRALILQRTSKTAFPMGLIE